MQAKREDTDRPAWSQDRLDSPFPPEIEAPYFDHALEAWVFSRYADILTAFRASSLSPSGFNNRETPAPPDDAVRVKMRTETLEALSPARLRSWREQLTRETQELFGALSWDRPVDLLSEYAQPLCLSLAAMVTGIPPHDAAYLCPIAHQVSVSSSEPYDQAQRAVARSANAELNSRFHSGPEALRDSGFVALTQTMPAVLGNAWFALVEHPQEWLLLHQQPELIEQAIEELLRYAGLARILMRTASADVNINGSLIRRGERVILRLFAANRDSERFSDPNQINITRRGAGHLTLGAGLHSCVAANLIRMTAIVITRPLLQRFAKANITRPVDWRGGSGFRTPNSLWVTLSEC